MLTIDECLNIAWDITDIFHFKPRPEPAEALEIIRDNAKWCGFNWITGQNAIEVLTAAVADPSSSSAAP